MGYSGVSRDNLGAALGNCVIELFRTADDVQMLKTVSDSAGNFRFEVLTRGPHYIVAYKAGSPDVAGTTINTLQPT